MPFRASGLEASPPRCVDGRLSRVGCPSSPLPAQRPAGGTTGHQAAGHRHQEHAGAARRLGNRRRTGTLQREVLGGDERDCRRAGFAVRIDGLLFVIRHDHLRNRRATGWGRTRRPCTPALGPLGLTSTAWPRLRHPHDRRIPRRRRPLPHRQAQTPGSPDAVAWAVRLTSGARRGRRCLGRRAHEPRDRRRVLHQRPHGRMAPAQGLHEARDHLAPRAPARPPGPRSRCCDGLTTGCRWAGLRMTTPHQPLRSRASATRNAGVRADTDAVTRTAERRGQMGLALQARSPLTSCS
jgi:hypothetical protein